MPLFSCCGSKSSTDVIKHSNGDTHGRKNSITFALDVDMKERKPGRAVQSEDDDDELFFFSCRDDFDDLDGMTQQVLKEFARESLKKGAVKPDSPYLLRQATMDTSGHLDELDYAPASVPDRHNASVFVERPESLMFRPAVPPEEEGAKQKELLNKDPSFSLRNTMILQGSLETSSLAIQSPGYPGELTREEMEKCVNFRRRLMAAGKECREVLLAQSAVEPEEYALCRWLRSRKFDVDKTMEFLTEGIDRFQEAKKYNFFPDADEAVGVPIALVLSQFPYIYSGYAKNGCPVLYCQGGHANMAGLECLIDLDKLENFAWHLFMHLFQQIVREAKQEKDNVRVEQLVVIDLKDLSSSSLNSSLDLLKKFSNVAQCFPEIMNRTIIINAPRFFSFAWGVVKSFLEERTVRKIAIYNNKEKGRNKLLEMIDKEQLLSDYGGDGRSFQELLQSMNKGTATSTADPLKRRIIELISKNNKSVNFTIQNGEKCRLMTVYSRSVDGAQFAIQHDKHLKTTLKVENPTPGSSPQPYSVLLSESPLSSGTITIQASSNGGSLGDFLIVADIY